MTITLQDRTEIHGEYKHGVPDGKWWSKPPDGLKKKWEMKDGVPEELDPVLKQL